jgi:hypothetical protein
VADEATVLELLARLTATPVRRGSILDMPLDEYVEEVARPEVAELFNVYVRTHTRPTLRSVLVDPRFRRWVEVSCRAPLGKKLEEELAIVSGVVEEEEHILEVDPVARASLPLSSPARPAQTAHATLADWAEEAGVAARLGDPAGALMERVPAGQLRSVLRGAGRATVADVLDGTVESGSSRLAQRDREVLASHAKAYVFDVGERELADRREAARVAALGHVPAGEGAHDFLAAIDEALARVAKPSSQGITLAAISLERAPVRIEVRASLVPARDGRVRTISIAFVLEDWRLSPLHTLIRSDAKEGRTADAARLVLGRTRRVLGDPRHPLHAPLVAYLNEPPWTRVLANLDTAVARSIPTTPRAETSVEWHVTDDRGVHVVPFVCDGQVGSKTSRRSTVDAIVRGQVGSTSAHDEAVARALWVAPAAYGYGYPQESRAPGEVRERAFRALSLLVGRDDVRGRGGVRLGVIEGSLGVALEAVDGGYRFVFDVDGERLDARDLRRDLDAAGYLLHVDVAQGRVLLAHVGTRQGSVLLALASEGAIFPASAGAALVERVVRLADMAPRAPRATCGRACPCRCSPGRARRAHGRRLAVAHVARPSDRGRPDLRPRQGAVADPPAGRRASRLRAAFLRGRGPALGSLACPPAAPDGDGLTRRRAVRGDGGGAFGNHSPARGCGVG